MWRPSDDQRIMRSTRHRLSRTSARAAVAVAVFFLVVACAFAARVVVAAASADASSLSGGGAVAPLAIGSQGARPFGGTIVGSPATGSIHCDHGYVEWQIPVNPRRLPMLMVHGSSTKTWDTTFDGRDGFKNVFLRRGYAVYLTDLPRTGRAGQACKTTTYTPEPDSDQGWFTRWRLGRWLPGQDAPRFYPGVQFPVNDPGALNEFFRIQYNEFDEPENIQIESDALAVLLREIGPAIVLTHSSTGIRGWYTAVKSPNVAAIVSYEPGECIFPEGEMPAPIAAADGRPASPGAAVPMADFLKLTRMPIQIVWGDYIPSGLDPANVGPLATLDHRRINVVRSKLMADAINRHGGHAEVVMLPEIGIHGNTHFMMQDLNSDKIADLLSEYLERNTLDGR
jgi:pimeloyl-ACP methyl ester carboxylesterase